MPSRPEAARARASSGGSSSRPPKFDARGDSVPASNTTPFLAPPAAAAPPARLTAPMMARAGGAEVLAGVGAATTGRTPMPSPAADLAARILTTLSSLCRLWFSARLLSLSPSPSPLPPPLPLPPPSPSSLPPSPSSEKPTAPAKPRPLPRRAFSSRALGALAEVVGCVLWESCPALTAACTSAGVATESVRIQMEPSTRGAEISCACAVK